MGLKWAIALLVVVAGAVTALVTIHPSTRGYWIAIVFLVLVLGLAVVAAAYIKATRGGGGPTTTNAALVGSTQTQTQTPPAPIVTFIGGTHHWGGGGASPSGPMNPVGAGSSAPTGPTGVAVAPPQPMSPTDEMIQLDFPITDDLTRYQGRWVAVRDGKVVESDIDPVALRVNPAVEEDDLLFLVPANSTHTLLL